MTRSQLRARILASVRPAIDAFAERVVDLLLDQLEEAQDHTLATVRAMLAGGGRAVEIEAAEEPAAPRGRRSVTCSICGEIGHTARSPRHRGEAPAAEPADTSEPSPAPAAVEPEPDEPPEDEADAAEPAGLDAEPRGDGDDDGEEEDDRADREPPFTGARRADRFALIEAMYRRRTGAAAP